jgi:hypothetical protein
MILLAMLTTISRIRFAQERGIIDWIAKERFWEELKVIAPRKTNEE